MSKTVSITAATLDQTPHEPREPRGAERIRWYRCPVAREDLAALNRRSDVKGLLQTGGFLAILATNAAVALYSASHWPWYVTTALVFWHGTCWHFLINGFHELVHQSVFRTRWINHLFLHVFAFLGWQNPHWFWASHMAHHKYTLHPPDDLEVVLPVKMTLAGYLSRAVIDLPGITHALWGQVRRACGEFNPDGDRWTAQLFPVSGPDARRRLVNWARVLVLGHGLILAVSATMNWWMIPLLVSLVPGYGRWLHVLCNETQHIGLHDRTPDFRLCCRTVYLNPLLSFLYWNMNYHTEHHMYAAVPCYNLPRLHRLIVDDMPPCPRGLLAAWRQIAATLARQKTDPAYRYLAPLPPAVSGENATRRSP